MVIRWTGLALGSGSGFRAQSLAPGYGDLGFEFRVSARNIGIRVSGSGSENWDSGFEFMVYRSTSLIRNAHATRTLGIGLP